MKKQKVKQNALQECGDLKMSISYVIPILFVFFVGFLVGRHQKQLDLNVLSVKKGMNIRSAPDKGAPLLGKVNKGDKVKITDKEVTWYNIICSKGQKGWIYKEAFE